MTMLQKILIFILALRNIINC